MRKLFGRLAVTLLLATTITLSAQAQKRTDQLTGAAAITGTNTFPLCQGCGAGVDMVSGSMSQLLTYLNSNAAVPIATGVTGLGTNVAAFLAVPSSANLNSALTTKTGTGNAVFSNNPVLVAPSLGTITSGDLTNATNVPMGAAAGTLLTTHGGTGGTTPSGTLLDNITGFSTLGLVQRTGNGAYTLTVPGTGVMTFIGTPIGNVLGTWLASGAAVANLGFTPPPNTRNLIAGTGLAGGGDLSADRTFSLATITANSLLGNATGATAAPTPIALPAGCTAGITYASGALSCVTSSGGASPTISDTYGHSFTTPSQLAFASGTVVSGVNGGVVTASQTSVVGRDLSGADATIASTDANTTVPVGPHTYTVPNTATTGFGNGFSFCADNQSSGAATFNVTTSQFVMPGGNVGTFVLQPGDQFCPQSDGTNYRTNPTFNYINLTTGLPVIGGGSNAGLALGSKSGNTTQFTTSTGTKVANNLVKWDASGNAVDSGISGTGTGISGAVTALSWVAGINPDKVPFFTVPSNFTTMTVTGISGRVVVPNGSAATIMIRKIAGGAGPCSSGTAMTTASFDTNGTQYSITNFTLTGSGAPTMNPGESLCADVTNGANMVSGSSIGDLTVAYTVP